MLVHEVGSEGKQVVDQVVADGVRRLQAAEIHQLNEAVLVNIDLLHHEKCNVACHFRERLRESRLVDVAHLENLTDLRHNHDLEVAEHQTPLVIRVDLGEELAGTHQSSGSKWIIAVGGSWGEHFSKPSFDLLLVHETVPLRIHQLEQCVEGLFKESGPFRRELPILLDLWELLLEQGRKLRVVEVSVEGNVSLKLF